MAEHIYDELQKIELDSTGYIRPLNKSTPNAQQRQSIVKKTTGKRCVFVWIGIIIGSGFSGITVFLVFKYGGLFSYNISSCFWTEWTSWTPCKTSLIIGKQTRTQKYTGFFIKCEEKEVSGTQFCYDIPDTFSDRKLDIRFDPTTLYSTCYLSDDNTTLSNRYTDRTPCNPKAESRFHNYKGAMFDKCVKNLTSIYYEIYFQYAISNNLLNNSLILEIGIGERNKIDNFYYVGNINVSGWSFYLINCLSYDNVCLYAEYLPRDIRTVIKRCSNNTEGTNVNGTFGLLLERQRNTFSLFYCLLSKIFCQTCHCVQYFAYTMIIGG